MTYAANCVYKIVYGYTASGRKKVARYASLDDARNVAQAIFEKTGIVVAIELA